jgi:hypothetical protein
MAFMTDFFINHNIPRGCNISFISLIPKVDNPSLITDYRTISLINVQYKIIAKVFANRLARVIDGLVGPEQSAFISNRQILDGPLVLNEVVDWIKKKKKKIMLFKVDFAKAFDTVAWNYLLKCLEFMGFGNKWISMIKACLESASSSILVNGSPSKEFMIERGL